MAQLTVICGPAGVGKSTFGRALAVELAACFLDSDTVSEPVVCAGLQLAGLDPNDRDSSEYKAAFRDAVYDCLYATAAENLPHVPVVMVGPFTREIQDEQWKEELEGRFGVSLEVVFVTCDTEERRKRMIARGNSRDLPKFADWDGYLAGSAESPPAFPHRLVRT